VHALRRRLGGGDARRAGDRGRVEGRRLGERHREDGAPAVDDVEREEERDLEPRLLDRDALQAPRVGHAVERQERPDAPGAHPLLAARRHGGAGLARRAGEHGELAELLLGRHEREQRVGHALRAAAT
jgi:hypothetical protein